MIAVLLHLYVFIIGMIVGGALAMLYGHRKVREFKKKINYPG